MRICYVVHSTSHFAAPYVEYFAAQGHEIHVISFSQEPLADARMHHPVGRPFDFTKHKLDYLKAIPTVRKMVKNIGPDLLHAHYLTSNGLVAAAAGFHPLVVSARGSDVYQSMDSVIRRRVIRWVMNRADLVNTVSPDLTAQVAALGVPAHKTLCLTQGIEPQRFDVPRRAAPDGRVRLICTRKLRRPYQPEIIVEALSRLAADGLEFRLVFAASGTNERAVRELVRARRLTDRVTFLGGYRLPGLPQLLADADVYVSASLWDGTSPALLEAMAAGLFPVVSDCPANREWLDGDGVGLFFEPDNVEELADRLTTAITRPELWPVAARQNRQTVAERADRQTNMGILAEHYDRLVAATGRSKQSRDRGKSTEPQP